MITHAVWLIQDSTVLCSCTPEFDLRFILYLVVCFVTGPGIEMDCSRQCLDGFRVFRLECSSQATPIRHLLGFSRTLGLCRGLSSLSKLLWYSAAHRTD